MKNNLKTIAEILNAEYPWYVKRPLDQICDAFNAFEAELRQRLRQYEKRMKEGNRNDAIFFPALLLCDILGIEDERELPSREGGGEEKT